MEVNYKIELLYTPFAPKNPLSNFAKKGGTIFLSKKKPLLIVAELADQQSSEEALRALGFKLKDAHDQTKAHSSPEEKPAVDEIEDEEMQFEKLKPRNASHSQVSMANEESERSDTETEEAMLVDKKNQMKFLFKCGDDLRQDNLTLQFFKIMDSLWQKDFRNMEMECYQVMETGE